MLFSRIYNWVKYKTLPPSLLFTNRLFVERDSKHRRVVSNFGLVFRNSKWSAYSRVNVNTSSRMQYMKTILYVLAFWTLVGFITSFSTYYDLNIVPSSIYSLLWFIADADLYIKVTAVASWMCILQLFVGSMHASLMGTLHKPTLVASNELNSFKALPKHLHKPLLYQYLITPSSADSLLRLTSATSNNTVPTPLILLAHHLYNLTGLLVKSEASLSSTRRVISELSMAESPQHMHYGRVNTTLGPVALDFILFGAKPSAKIDYTAELTRWSLSEVSSELKNYNNQLTGLTGLFYLPSTTHTEYEHSLFSNLELGGLRNATSNQLTAIRQQRWLYKYNLMHRSAIKNSHNITLAKRLINSGFMSSSLTERNMWASSTLNSLAKNAGHLGQTRLPYFNSSQLKATYTTLYGNYLNPSEHSSVYLNHTPVTYNSTGLVGLNSYESSYQWFLQRAYQFNSLSSSGFTMAPRLATDSARAKTAVSQSVTNSTVLFDVLASTGSTHLNTTSPLTSITPSSDYYLHYSDYSLLDKARSEQLTNLLRNRTASKVLYYSPTKIINDTTPKA